MQTDDAQKPVFIGTILHCTYSFRGLRPRLHWDSAPGPRWGKEVPQTLCSPVTPPCHYILDKGLVASLVVVDLSRS